MLKASTPVVVLILSVVFGIDVVSFIEFNIVSLISLGVALASLGELRFSWIGFIFQTTAICAEASRLVMTSSILKRYKLDSLSTLYYVAPLCSALNFICCLFLESSRLPWSDRIFTGSFIIMLLLNGLVAFSLNITSVMLIQHTSPLVLTLAGIVKDIMLVCSSMVIFQAPVTPLQFLGYAVTLLALNLHKEFKKNPAILDKSIPPASAAVSAAASREPSTTSNDRENKGSLSPGRRNPQEKDDREDLLPLLGDLRGNSNSHDETVVHNNYKV
jgi:hypothetical protein